MVRRPVGEYLRLQHRYSGALRRVQPRVDLSRCAGHTEEVVPQPDRAVDGARQQPIVMDGEGADGARVSGQLVDAAHHPVVPHAHELVVAAREEQPVALGQAVDGTGRGRPCTARESRR